MRVINTLVAGWLTPRSDDLLPVCLSLADARDPLSSVHPFYMLIETSGAEQAHDQEVKTHNRWTRAMLELRNERLSDAYRRAAP